MDKNNERLEERVEEALKEERFYRVSDIKVQAYNGEVVLQGVVDALAEKIRAEEIVRGVPGVRFVENNLTVAMDRPITDAEIVAEVSQRLANHPLGNLARRVQVGCSKGVVLLTGKLSSLAEINGVLAAVSEVLGVKEIINQLTVEGDRDDATLTNEVERALSQSTYVDSREVKTRVMAGKAILTGEVDTQEQIDKIIRVVSQVPGIKKIESRLSARHGHLDRDNILTNRVREALGREGLAMVRAFVRNGTAYLAGEVLSPDQRERAGEIVGNIEGITSVQNDLTIVSH